MNDEGLGDRKWLNAREAAEYAGIGRTTPLRLDQGRQVALPQLSACSPYQEI
jgi:hypothetical protein